MTRQLIMRTERWPTRIPFRISRTTWEAVEVIVCEIVEGPYRGRGEACGVFYLDETVEGMQRQIDSVAARVAAGALRNELLRLLPPGGARNALDCALWDLEAQQGARSAWAMAGVADSPVRTVFTIGLEDTPARMAELAAAAADRPLLKIKLNADRPVERVAAIRAVRPDARLIADVNGGWTFAQLREHAAPLADLGLALLEQPLPRGEDQALLDFDAPLPLFADESCLHAGEVGDVAARYDGVVIKLDKAGGLTGALEQADAASAAGLRLMVGCMLGTSLAMLPAHVLAQRCEFVDIDGALLLAHDRSPGLRYEGANVVLPSPCLWGMPV